MIISRKSIKRILKKILRSIILLFYVILLGGLIIGGISSGIMTLIPDDASKPCYLGYYAHCSFTPLSTLILFAMAIIGIILFFKLAKSLKRKKKNINQSKKILEVVKIN